MFGVSLCAKYRGTREHRAPCSSIFQHASLPIACLSHSFLLVTGVIWCDRFDLLHVMLDELTEEEDGRIAEHIVALHKNPAATIRTASPFDTEQLQRYIKYARAIKPRLTTEVRREAQTGAGGAGAGPGGSGRCKTGPPACSGALQPCWSLGC